MSCRKWKFKEPGTKFKEQTTESTDVSTHDKY